MKKINVLFVIGVLFLTTAFVLSSGCKKKTDDPTPTPSAPTFVATAVPYSGDPTYIEIMGKCTSEDVQIIKITIKSPMEDYVYTGSGDYWIQNEYFYFPDVYLRQAGTWKLVIVGKKTDTGSTSFTGTCSFTVSGK